MTAGKFQSGYKVFGILFKSKEDMDRENRLHGDCLGSKHFGADTQSKGKL